MNKENKNKSKEGDEMITSINSTFVVREDKTKDFLKKINTPMITKEFLAECKKVSDSIRKADSRKKK